LNKRFTAIGLVTWIVAGIPHFTRPEFAGAPLWWLAAYLAFGALFFVATNVFVNGRHPLIAIAGEAVLALVLIMIQPAGFMAILLVIVAAQAGGELTFRATMAWIAVQSTALAIIFAMTPSMTAPIITALSYLTFQLFGAFTANVARSEMHARQELSQTHAELRVATELLGINSRTAERLRIARDLHDMVGHHLTALSLNLEVASHLTEGEPRQHIEKSKAIAKDLLRDVRGVVSRMRDDDPVDLAAALRAVADAIPSPAVLLELEDGLSVNDATVAQVALRCVQEIVTNAVRHSCAKTLRLRIAKSGDALTIDAQDDGIGADQPRAGNGLRGMRERVEQAGGTVAVDSARGRGFGVRIHIPNPDAAGAVA
jgi:signal transduction histidine kinase